MTLLRRPSRQASGHGFWVAVDRSHELTTEIEERDAIPSTYLRFCELPPSTISAHSR